MDNTAAKWEKFPLLLQFQNEENDFQLQISWIPKRKTLTNAVDFTLLNNDRARKKVSKSLKLKF